MTDEDFRWRVLRALCALGAAGLDDVAREQDRDPSSQGALHALSCRAALPDPAVKEEVWESITTDPDLSNYELYALVEAFFRRDQVELTAPYVERYFTDIPGTAKIRTGWMVERTAELGFPKYAVEAGTVARAEACLDDETLDTGAAPPDQRQHRRPQASPPQQARPSPADQGWVGASWAACPRGSTWNVLCSTSKCAARQLWRPSRTSPDRASQPSSTTTCADITGRPEEIVQTCRSCTSTTPSTATM